ncbi:MAG: ubiquinol-cytochrome c reductase iron-sulfur subunit [Gemmatimonadetes bacterium]|nr:ubiquinol-cytochrome c reductase iron-sulfur subunit [Gemmatimonadota bacterium]
MDRRRFVGLATGAIASAALPACATLVVTPVAPVGGVVRLAIRNFAQLGQPGGYLKIQPIGEAAPLFVLALGGGEFAVLSPICTHLACTVNVEGAQLVCPCHGSMFDRQGRVLRGPAERPLRRFPAALTPEGELVIQLGSAA